jgi:transcriptional regulator with XRE-family HTH domain
MQNIEVVFGKVVRKRRQELGLSQEDFADKAGIHRTYVSSIELGKVQVSIRIAEQLALALETPLSRIWKQVESDRD